MQNMKKIGATLIFMRHPNIHLLPSSLLQDVLSYLSASIVSADSGQKLRFIAILHRSFLIDSTTESISHLSFLLAFSSATLSTVLITSIFFWSSFFVSAVTLIWRSSSSFLDLPNETARSRSCLSKSDDIKDFISLKLTSVLTGASFSSFISSSSVASMYSMQFEALLRMTYFP